MVSKILFPVDGSQSSRKAIDYVKDMALKFNAEVVLFNAYDMINRLAYESSIDHLYLQEVEEKIQAKSQKLIDEFKSILDDNGIKVKSVLSRENASHEIVRVSKAENCDLIVMGSRGLSNLKSILLGSVSQYVIHHAECSVLLIH